jgi:hypothetical protein
MTRESRHIRIGLGMLKSSLANVLADVDGYRVVLIAVNVPAQAFGIDGHMCVDVIGQLTVQALEELREEFRPARTLGLAPDWEIA